jgi:hypothetical protein
MSLHARQAAIAAQMVAEKVVRIDRVEDILKG